MAAEAAIATLDRLWSLLEPLGYPLAVMGGISLAAWGRIRATRESTCSWPLTNPRLNLSSSR